MHGWTEAAGGGGREGGASLDQAHLVVVGRELMEQLLDAVLLSGAVHVGHLVLRQGAVVLMNLTEKKTQTSGWFYTVICKGLLFCLWV